MTNNTPNVDTSNVVNPTQEQQNVPDPVSSNPLLGRIQMPGETFTLPSCGLFYNNGELSPDVTNGEVHVHPMTVLDEIVIKSPDMLFSGTAVEQVFGRCIPQVKKPMQLLAKDVDFLLVCLRRVSYGPEVEISDIHFDCKSEAPKEHNYVVDVNQFIQKTKRIDATKMKQQFYITLPNGQEVIMQPIRFGDFVEMMQAQEQEHKMNPEEQVQSLIKSLSSVIVSVDTITNRQQIQEWLKCIKPEYLNKLNKKIEDTVKWGTKFEVKVKCNDCSEFMNITVPMNPLVFFM